MKNTEQNKVNEAEKMDVWARIGATVKVDKTLFNKDPEEALKQAILKGDYQLDGETYVPENCAYEGSKEIEIVL